MKLDRTVTNSRRPFGVFFLATLCGAAALALALLDATAALAVSHLVYRSDSNAGSLAPQLHEYNPSTDTWTARASLPTTNYSQLASDGATIYAMPTDNRIYRYDRNTDAWVYQQDGPGAAVVGGPIDMFETHNGEFYAGKDGDSTLYYTLGGVWNSVPTPRPLSSASGLDRFNNQIYIRTWFQLGGFVYDIASGTFPTVFDNVSYVGENGRAGEYYQGYFYSRDWLANLSQVDPGTGLAVDTGVPLLTTHASSAIVDLTGQLYMNGYLDTEQSFEVFNIGTNTVTALVIAPALINGNGHSTLAVVTLVPEPAGFALGAIGLLCLATRRLKRRSP